jgi:hypothetical protein
MSDFQKEAPRSPTQRRNETLAILDSHNFACMALPALLRAGAIMPSRVRRSAQVRMSEAA